MIKLREDVQQDAISDIIPLEKTAKPVQIGVQCVQITRIVLAVQQDTMVLIVRKYVQPAVRTIYVTQFPETVQKDAQMDII